MKITREEFKELVALRNRVMEFSEKAREFIQDDVIDELTRPLDWVLTKLDFLDYGTDWDLLYDLWQGKGIPISWQYDFDGYWTNIIYSSDLDEIYDKYLA